MHLFISYERNLKETEPIKKWSISKAFQNPVFFGLSLIVLTHLNRLQKYDRMIWVQPAPWSRYCVRG